MVAYVVQSFHDLYVALTIEKMAMAMATARIMRMAAPMMMRILKKESKPGFHMNKTRETPSCLSTYTDVTLSEPMFHIIDANKTYHIFYKVVSEYHSQDNPKNINVPCVHG